MSSQKNQHYVPKVHLKPFTTERNGRSISLFNIQSGKLIHNASISGQCASNFFYGEDLVLENMFCKLEGRYGAAIDEIEAGSVSTDAEEWLRMFLVFQYLRTKRAVERTRQQLENGLLTVTARGKRIEGAENFDTSPKALLAYTLGVFPRMLDYLQDLKIRVIRSECETPFVTSDAPLIFTNRFYIQQLRMPGFGAASSGALLLLPLGARLCAVAYDAQMYTAEKSDGFISLTKQSDVEAINEMQYLYAHQNIYFSSPDDGPRISAEFAEVEHLRPAEFFTKTELAEVERGSGTRTFRRVETTAEADAAPSKFVTLESNHPRPRVWPACLRFRADKKFFFAGSGIGHVRKKEWLNGEKPPPAY